MCGIVGYIGKKNAIPILMEGLKRESYRGYDSSGIVVLQGNEMNHLKAVGKLENLEAKLTDSFLAGEIGLGHCLSPDTLIQMADGRILEILKIKERDKVLSLDPETLKFSVGEVRVLKHKSPDYLYRIQTSSTSIEATANHKIMVFLNGKIQEKKIAELSKEDLLIFPKRILVSGEKIKFKEIFAKKYYKINQEISQFIRNKMTEMELSTARTASLVGISESYVDHIIRNDRNFREDELQKILPFFSIKICSEHFIPQNTIHGKFITLPRESSPELMQIIGYFLGDGNLQKRSLRFKDTNKEVLKVYQELFEKTFNIKGRIVPLKGTAANLFEVNSLYLRNWFQKNITLRKEEFLSEVGKLPDEEISAFLRGLFDAEGSISVKASQICFTNTNRNLTKIIQLLFLRFGLKASLHKEERREKTWRDRYVLYFSSYHSFNKFKEKIGFSSKEKIRKLDFIIEKIDKKRVLKKEIENSEIIPEKILSIRRIKSDTDYLYDIEVNPHSNFIANGLLSHNSRWATHGEVTEENAHPHHDCQNNIWLVHNGIVENYKELKKKLEAKGHKFVSQTDTEVLPHLIENFFQGNLEDAVRKALKLVKGTYGLAIISKKDPGKIVAARMASPLVISVNGTGGFVASDPAALVSHSNKAVFLEDGEIAVITPEEFTVTDLGNNQKTKEPVELEWTVEEAQKGGYPHFMLKEIMEQPESLENSLRGRIILENGEAKLGGLSSVQDKLRDIERMHIVACGTARHAGLAGEYMLEEYAGILTKVDAASEFRYRKSILDKKTAVLAISQSGETADTLAAIKEAKSKGILTLGITNVVGSTQARETDAGIYNHAGPEIGVASTKAYTSQLVVLALLALYLGRQRQLSLVMGQRIAKELSRIPELVGQVLKNNSQRVEEIAKKYKSFSNFLFLGRKYNFPTALEGALKLKEISYMHAEGYGAGEMKHGPIALIDEAFPTLAICPSDSVYEKMISSVEEIKARKGLVIAIATEGNEGIKELADDVIYIPKTLEMLTPILAAIPLQLFAYHMGVLRECDVDRPRNLAKSVTVE